jgi:hypothetical protein
MAAALGYVLAAVLSGDMAARWPWLGIALFTGFGIINSYNGFRSLSGVALLTAVFLGLSLLLARGRWTARPRAVRILAGVGLYGVSGLFVYAGLSAATSAGWFGAAAQIKFEDQAGITIESPSPGPSGALAPGASIPVGPAATPRANVPVGVLLGGRSEILPSTQAILDSPIIGHGSWARGPEYVELQRQRLVDLGVPRGNISTDPTLIPTHSYLLGSWVWAGFLGGIFWIGVAGLAIWTVANVLGSRLQISPLVGYVAALLLWSIAFSPYSNTERIYAMFAVVVCLLALRLVRQPSGDLGMTPEPTAE